MRKRDKKRRRIRRRRRRKRKMERWLGRIGVIKNQRVGGVWRPGKRRRSRRKQEADLGMRLGASSGQR